MNIFIIKFSQTSQQSEFKKCFINFNSRSKTACRGFKSFCPWYKRRTNRDFFAFLNKISKGSFIDRFGEIYGTVRTRTITNQILKKKHIEKSMCTFFMHKANRFENKRLAFSYIYKIKNWKCDKYNYSKSNTEAAA